MADAPVCHVPGKETIDQPRPSLVPNIPAATDLPSALRAIRALTDAIRVLTGQIRPGNQSRHVNFNPGTPYRGGNDPGKGDKGNDGGTGPGGGFRTQEREPQWIESGRVEKKVKIPIGDSPDDFVEVTRIEELDMIDRGTKNTWKWKRTRG